MRAGHGEGVAVNQAFLAALLDPAAPIPDGLVTWNGSDPALRFAVYRNNVAVSLIDALQDTFPVTAALVGEAFFRAMARDFIYQAPPRSPQLVFYGAEFPAFITSYPPAVSLPYLADVARLEFVRGEVCHAADGPALSLSLHTGQLKAQLAAALAQPERLAALRVVFIPAATLLRSRYACVSLWAAHQGVGDLGAIDPATPEQALIIRPGLQVDVIPLNAAAAEFVANLMQGQTLGAALAVTSGEHPDYDLASLITLLLQHQVIATLVETPTRQGTAS